MMAEGKNEIGKGRTESTNDKKNATQQMNVLTYLEKQK
jgi:hypothetical protein